MKAESFLILNLSKTKQKILEIEAEKNYSLIHEKK